MPNFTSVDELLTYLSIGEKRPERVPGELLESLLDSAEQFAEAYTGRSFTPNPASDSDPAITKTFKVRNRNRMIRVPDLRSVDTLTVDGVTLSEDIGYDLYLGDSEPATHIKLVDWTPWTSTGLKVNSTLAITGHWGWNPTPSAVKDAVLTMASRRYRERDAMFSDVVQTEAGVFNYLRTMPEYIKSVLDQYRVPRVSLV